MIELVTCRCARWAATGDVICGKRRYLAFEGVFFIPFGLDRNESFGHQEAIGCDARLRMMVESAPASTFIVTKTEALFQVLVIALMVLREASGLVCYRFMRATQRRRVPQENRRAAGST